jgi:hypothetical protein
MTAKATAILTRDAILNAEDRVRELVHVPEWGGSVWVRSLEGIERDRLESSFVKYGKVGNRLEADFNVAAQDVVRARLCAMTIVDEEWKNLFTESDILVLTHKNAAALDRVFQVAQRLSGLTERDVEALKEQLGEGLSSPSGSDSPGT